MPTEYDICIRGAGIVGRTLALLLARERLRVALVAPAERASKTADVRAYSISPGGQALLQDLRCWPAPEHATPVLAMEVAGDAHGSVHFSAAMQRAPALNWIVDVPELERLLAEAVNYQSAIDCVSEPVDAPLTVVCEGRASATRASLGVGFDATPYFQRAVATRLDCEHPHQQIARQWFTASGEILAFLPLGGADGREVAVVWSVPDARAAEVQEWDDEQFAAELHTLSSGLLGALGVQGPRGSWPLVVGQADRWVGNIPGATDRSFALAGDAAHALHPLAGLGLNVGLGDVAELAAILAAREPWRPLSDLRLLRRYERARQGKWLRTRWATDGLQRLFTYPAPFAGELRNWGMRAFDHTHLVKAAVTRLAMKTV